jgi:hypothetical protein
MMATVMTIVLVHEESEYHETKPLPRQSQKFQPAIEKLKSAGGVFCSDHVDGVAPTVGLTMPPC